VIGQNGDGKTTPYVAPAATSAGASVVITMRGIGDHAAFLRVPPGCDEPVVLLDGEATPGDDCWSWIGESFIEGCGQFA
jgi:hypothetical protein